MSRPVKCGNCGWTGTEDDCEMIDEPWERLDPGPIYGEVPAGQCPGIVDENDVLVPEGERDKDGTSVCGSLCYLNDEESNARRKLNRAAPKLAAALKAIVHAGNFYDDGEFYLSQGTDPETLLDDANAALKEAGL